jgi:hypothetical protein
MFEMVPVLTMRTSTATVPYDILNSLSPLMTLIKKIAKGAKSTICKILFTTTMMALTKKSG